MPDPDESGRVKKSDAAMIAAMATAVGLQAFENGPAVAVYHNHRWVGSFYWNSATESDPGGWKLNIGLIPVYSWSDVRRALTELRRVAAWYGLAVNAWKAFSSSRSEKRWVTYQGLIAALILRQEAP